MAPAKRMTPSPSNPLGTPSNMGVPSSAGGGRSKLAPAVDSSSQQPDYAPLLATAAPCVQANGSISGAAVAERILPRFPTILSAVPDTCRLAATDNRPVLDATRIRCALSSTGCFLHRHGLGRGNVVALVLPNGPDLARAIFTVSCYATCLPLNALGAAAEWESDVRAAAVDAVIGNSATVKGVAEKEGLRYFDWDEVTKADGEPAPTEGLPVPNHHDDTILLLFTSGTTGQKKLVPHLLADVLVATACIGLSWQLTAADTNCNLMPLFHVGGIVRQVFSPLLSGGCVICCPSFDPLLFWHLLRRQEFTWYYAAPTMHQLILSTGHAEGLLPLQSCSLRLIANAAGGLLPSLARELRQVFHAHILPGYGMTECMPISSPPATYLLEKPGTSGVAVGPELTILNLENGLPLQACKEGPICVRGAPVFRGYRPLAGDVEGAIPQSFLPDGWFPTGDLGYMDTDGYLYITGRSKEVINRGGEIISPMEVEEACLGHPRVEACVAFSAKHALLQEVVGLLVVPVPDRPRLDLNSLHAYLQGRLAAAKWPQCIVYIDALPKSHTNKLLRVRLGKRLGLPELRDGMYAVERTYQAKCPSQGTPVSVAIPCERVAVNANAVQEVLRDVLIRDEEHQQLSVVPHPAKMGALVAYVRNIDRLSLVRAAQECVDAYAVPGHVCCITSGCDFTAQPQPSDAVASIIQELASAGEGPTDSLVMEVQELVQMLLDLDCLPAPTSDFFRLGGSSMLASQLASQIRKLYGISFGGAEVFHHTTCLALAAVIREQKDGGSTDARSAADPASQAASSLFSKRLDVSRTHFDANRVDVEPGWRAKLFQLLPLFVIYPLWHLTRLFLFFSFLLWTLHAVPQIHNLYKFVLTLVVFHAVWVTFTPLLFIVVKWSVIGEYKTGRYPIYGEYYLRWWFVDVLRKLTGRGFWGSHDILLNQYYRWLGANIGHNVRISLTADLAEYDLVTVKDGAAVEYSTVRAFGVDNGCMILGPVTIGQQSSVGVRSVVAPYTTVPDHCDLGPATSSYENPATSDHNHQHLSYNRQALPEPYLTSQIAIIGPILFFINTASHMPALAVLYMMMQLKEEQRFDTMADLMEWLCDVRRIPYYIGVRVARSVATPLVYMFFAILIKWFVIGKFQAGPRELTEWEVTRQHLTATIFNRENMQECTELLGRHYEMVSCLYRLLGAKIGKRVFWPGDQAVFSGEFDLLEVGDDVVFGSRATILCTTASSYERVVFCAGANISDNTVVLPGSIVGKNAVLGSNSVCPRGRYLPEQSVWFGARNGEPVLLEKGPGDTSRPISTDEIFYQQLPMLGDHTTIRPFGRAFTEKTPYVLFPVWVMVLFTLATRVGIAILHTSPVLAAIHLAGGYLFGWSERRYSATSGTEVFGALLFFYLATHFLSIVIWFYVEVISKWGLLGQRIEGRYNYDTSSYSQRWELYQILTKVRFKGRLNILDLITGSPFMTAFFRSLGLKSGKHCCLYPAGGDPYMPEPDLVEMGDRCVVDCSSIVCHLNTRGNFELAKIRLENNVTLRTRSRLQQAVHMEENSMLLEKGLVMTGEVIEADSIWVGAPAVRLMSYDTSSINTVSCTGSQGGQFV